MRFLIFFNLIAIVVIGAALARMYQGTPLPWQLHYAKQTVAPASEPASAAPPPSSTASRGFAIPEENPKRVISENVGTPADKRPLRFLTEGNYPPFNERDNDGNLVGYDVDTANAICRRLQRHCEIATRAWKDLLPALRQGEADAVIASMLIGAPAISGKAEIAFSRAYYTTPGHFAARRGDASLTTLAKHTIAVQAGSTHEAFLKARFPDAKRLVVKTLDEAKKALADRRADLVFADRNALLIWLKSEKRGTCCHLVGGDYANPEYFGEGAGIAVRENDKLLLGEIDKALAGMARDGEEARIARRYFGQSIR